MIGSRKLARMALALALGVAAAGAGVAQEHGHEETGHEEHGAMPGDMPESSRAYMEANERMHAGMAIELTGDADVDFARGMIPHHQGAIDMAQALLEHGSDPALLALAREIIADQEAEIAFLEAWLAETLR